LKTQSLKYFFYSTAILLIIACSTKKNTFVNRNWHALNTEYNTLYNGGIAYDKGIEELKAGYVDNFWEILPIERMQIPEESFLPGQKPKNENFERAETKATKAIQKHSMNIKGNEENMQMDEAHLLLGKTRYYDLRFIPALEAFNYILYKYSDSDKIYEAKVWREKTNVRLENDELAIKNLTRLIKQEKLTPKVFADANALLSQAYVNLEKNDTAIAPLKKALRSTRLKEEKARYHFILGQLYESLDYKDSAYAEFQKVIEMKRKSPKIYVMQAHARQFQLIDPTTDTILFLKKYDKLFKDRENRPHLDILNHQMALFYDKLNKKNQAVKYYNSSLRSKSTDIYLEASNYRNLAKIYFDKAKYAQAGQYYDSTLIKLVKKNREYFTILKKRENLDDVIKYEGIVTVNDSILKLVAMTEDQRKEYFNEYIKKIKEKEEALKAEELKKQKLASINTGIQDIVNQNPNQIAQSSNTIPSPKKLSPSSSNEFYFYNPSAVEYGKVEFKKRWGKRQLTEKWRLSSISNNNGETQKEDELTSNTPDDVAKPNDSLNQEKYDVNFYIKQIPTSNKVIDSLFKQRNNSNFQLGTIYKEKFKEYKLSASKFETVLFNKPEDKLVLPSLYNLYKIYDIIDKPKSETYKSQIILNYPNTRYAQILSGKISEENTSTEDPKERYKKIYKQLNNQEYASALENLEKSLSDFAGDELIPKFELMKANTIGKFKGLEEYKKALTYVSVTYPNTEESKRAQDILDVNIPKLEQLTFANDSLSKSWKILYKVNKKEDPETTTLTEKIKKMIAEKRYDNYNVSFDVYNQSQNFVVVHGISSREYATFLIELLRDTKEYKIKLPAKVISSENYTIIQIKKNYNELEEKQTIN
jgi:tetratricopeptide (TPR) repeat protein